MSVRPRPGAHYRDQSRSLVQCTVAKTFFFFISLAYIANEHTRTFDPFLLLLFSFFYSLDATIAPPSLLKKMYIFPPLQTLFVLLFFLLSFAPYFVSLYIYLLLHVHVKFHAGILYRARGGQRAN